MSAIEPFCLSDLPKDACSPAISTDSTLMAPGAIAPAPSKSGRLESSKLRLKSEAIEFLLFPLTFLAAVPFVPDPKALVS